jgi:hypothetical protein
MTYPIYLQGERISVYLAGLSWERDSEVEYFHA